MAKAKESASAKAPLKGEKGRTAPKASTTARSKPSNLSQEFVVNSGSDSDVSKPGSSSGGHSDTESEDEKRKNTKKPKPQKVKVTEPEDPPVPDDTSEDESDRDDEESESEEEAAAKNPVPQKPSKAAPKINGVKRKLTEPSLSEEESKDETDDDELPDQPVSKKQKTPKSGPDDKNKRLASSPSRAEQPVPAAAKALPPQPYEPPPGYTAVDASAFSGGNAFSQSNLNDKQIWHIAAPSGVPLSSITEVALDTIRGAKPVLSHKGIDYMLSEDQSVGSNPAKLLLPSKDGYEPTRHPVAKTLHLQQKITLPNLSQRQSSQVTGSDAAADVAKASVTSVRPQPKGLRMRYKPPGFGVGRPGMIGSSDDSDVDAQSTDQATFQLPKSLGAHGTDLLQDVHTPAVEAVSAADNATKKAKKRKKEKQGISASNEMLNGTSTIVATPSKPAASSEAATPAQLTLNGITSNVESKEDKAKRKEEKRLKRERKEAQRGEKGATASSAS